MDPTPTVGKLPEIRVNLLKRRKALASGRAKEIQNRIDNRKRDKQRRNVRFKRLESYVAQYQRQEKDLKRAKRVTNELLTKKKTDREKRIETKDFGRATFVVRVRGINQVHPRVRKAMAALGLYGKNMGVFVRLNETVKRLLKISEPYIIYGVPSAQVIRELVYKRGVGRNPPGAVHDYKKVTLADNRAIEDTLGEHGIICIDDIVHELQQPTEAFAHVAAFLLPFKLSVPRGGWRRASKVYADGAEFGHCGKLINHVLEKMI